MKKIHGLASVSLSMLILGTILLVLGVFLSIYRQSVEPIWQSAIGVGAFYFIAFMFWHISIIKYNNETILIRSFPWTKPSIIQKDNIQLVKWKVESQKSRKGRVDVEIFLKKHDKDGYNKYELTLNSQTKLAELFLSHPYLIKSLLK